jgi:hypothetical protein
LSRRLEAEAAVLQPQPQQLLHSGCALVAAQLQLVVRVRDERDVEMGCMLSDAGGRRAAQQVVELGHGALSQHEQLLAAGG